MERQTSESGKASGADPVNGRPLRGRRPSTTRRHAARAALELFAANGYEETTVEEVAAAAGISRRTLFRYFPTKADLVWGDFDDELERLADHLAAAPADEPIFDVVRRAVVATNHFGAGALDELRIRITLITTVPALVAHSALRYGDWLDVVARFAAGRLGVGPDDLRARTVAHVALGAATAAYEHWAAGGGDDPAPELDRALGLVAGGFAGNGGVVGS